MIAGSIPVLADLGLFDYSFSLYLVDYARTLAADDPSELAPAYMALFEVGAGGAPCPPTESAWLAGPQHGDVAVILSELRRSYLRYGLRPSPSRSEGVDHVTVEFDVMASLCGMEAEQRAANRQIDGTVGHQIEFLRDHLGRWLPLLTKAVVRLNGHPSYTALALAAHALVIHDQELLALIGEQEPSSP
jgi:TorA maturation chaperone TorD